MHRSLPPAFGLLLAGLTLAAGWTFLKPDETAGSGGSVIDLPGAPTTKIAGDPARPVTETVTYLIGDRASFNPADLASELTLALSAGKPAEIRVDTHTDTLLEKPDSQAMTDLWAAEVDELLVLLGADPAIITTTAHGETDLAVETEDGVREPANRRVVVTVVYGQGPPG